MDIQTNTAPEARSQDLLYQLVQDVRQVRERAFQSHPRSKTGIAAGQFLILLLQIQKGERVRPRRLRGFFHFISRDRESSQDAE